jgi:hypothetical protein
MRKEHTIELELLVDILVLLRLVHRHVDRHDVLKVMEMSFDRILSIRWSEWEAER